MATTTTAVETPIEEQALVDELWRKVRHLERELAIREQVIADREAAYAELDASVAEHARRLRAAEDELDNHRRVLAEVTAHLRKTERDRDAERRHLLAELETLRHERDFAVAARRTAEDYARALVRTASWRLTAPLRWLGSRLTGRPIGRFVALAMLAALTAHAGAQETVRTLEQEVFAGDATKVHVNLAVGNLTIEGTDGRSVEIALALACTREDEAACRRRAEKIRLAPRLDDGELKVKLKRTSRGRLRGIKARMTVRVPSRLPLEVDVRAGDVRIAGMASHLNVDATAGDVEISGSRARTAEVNALSGVGAVNLWLPDSRIQGTGFPRSLRWRGTGTTQIEIDVGTGDVTVRLE